MARPRRVDELTRCRSAINHAKNYRQREGLDDTWLRMVDLYRGKHFPNATNEDRIAVNLAFSTVNVIFPSVSINHPKITIAARKPEDEDRATIAEAVINYWFRRYDFRTPFRYATKDSLITGVGWVKVGWAFEEREEELDDDEYAEQFADAVGQAEQFAADNPELAADVPTDEQIAEGLPTTKMVVVRDQPIMERVSPHDIFVDPEATSEDELAWIAQRIVRPLSEAKNDERYDKSARSKLKADSGLRADLLDPSEKDKRDPQNAYCTIWEFYDLRKKRFCVFADGLEDSFLVKPQPTALPFEHPFVLIPNYTVPDRFYPMGELENIEDIQQELNKTRSQMLNYRKKYGRKILYRESAFSKEGKAALASVEDNIAVPVADENRSFAEVAAPFPMEKMDAALFNLSEVYQNDIDTISGVNEYARGATPEIRRTATEAAIIQDAANARAADKLASIEQCYAKIARKITQLAQRFVTGEQVAKVVGRDQAILWVPFDRDDIDGEFDFEVEAGSTQPNNETFRRQQAVTMAQMVGPFIQMGVINPEVMADHLLREGFGIKNTEKFFMRNAQMEAQQQMAEQQLMMAQQGPPMEGPPPEEGIPEDPPIEQAIPPEMIAQLQGQVGLPSPTTMVSG